MMNEPIAKHFLSQTDSTQKVKPTPNDYPHLAVRYDVWTESYRAARIQEVLVVSGWTELL